MPGPMRARRKHRRQSSRRARSEMFGPQDLGTLALHTLHSNRGVLGNMADIGCVPVQTCDAAATPYVGFFLTNKEQHVLRVLPCRAINVVLLTRVLPPATGLRLYTEEDKHTRHNVFRIKANMAPVERLSINPSALRTAPALTRAEAAQLKTWLARQGVVKSTASGPHSRVVLSTARGNTGDDEGNDEAEASPHERWLAVALRLGQRISGTARGSGDGDQGHPPVRVEVSANCPGEVVVCSTHAGAEEARSFTEDLEGTCEDQPELEPDESVTLSGGWFN